VEAVIVETFPYVKQVFYFDNVVSILIFFFFFYIFFLYFILFFLCFTLLFFHFTLLLFQIMVYGPSTSSSLIGIVVPEWDYLLSKERNEETHGENWGDGAVKRYWSGVKDPEKSPVKSKKGGKEDKVVEKEKSSLCSSSSSTKAYARKTTETAEDTTIENPVSSSKTSQQQAVSEINAPLPLRIYLSKDSELKSFMLSVIKKGCESQPEKVRRFEIPKGLVICGEEWSDQNRCLTPSMKVKRDFIRNKYKDEFQAELSLVEGQENKDKTVKK
jgi:long-subunit acyl-CoA synthetase (AMP-forming)